MTKKDNKFGIEDPVKYLQDLSGLIDLCEVNLLVCQKLYLEIIQLDNRNEVDFWRLAANNSFFEAISLLHTLLYSTKKEEITLRQGIALIIIKDKRQVILDLNEINIKDNFVRLVNEHYPDNFFAMQYLHQAIVHQREAGSFLQKIFSIERQKAQDELLELKQIFKEKKFNGIRHESSAHRNKFLLDPAGRVNLLLMDHLIIDALEIVRQMKIKSFFWFGYIHENRNMFILHQVENIIASSR
jgi:hypothetical protein